MPVDISSEIVIDRPRAEVAAFAGDPDNAPAWYEHVKRVVWRTRRPLAVGTQVGFLAESLGRQLEFIYEVTALVPGERLVMRSEEGRFPMETTYSWRDEPGGGTRMSLSNHAEPRGVGRLSASLLKRSMRRANAKDLSRLKHLLESGV
ncbi:MAG TPA: SRPBCC family protein [Actinomycetota bacterium]|nr:SRPBCC family protein [Actinomycetota bacterium]